MSQDVPDRSVGKPQNDLIFGGNDGALCIYSSENSEEPEPFLPPLLEPPQTEVFAMLPPQFNEPGACSANLRRSCAFSSASAEGPPGKLTSNSPRYTGSPHGCRGGLAHDFDHVQDYLPAAAHVSPHGSGGGFADENLGSNLDGHVQSGRSTPDSHAGILVSTSQDTSVMLMRQSFVFDVRGEEWKLNRPMGNFAELDSLCAAILYSTGGGDPVLQIDTSPSNLAIEWG